MNEIITDDRLTGKHRCLNCGQLKEESELYFDGQSDWACVDPEHSGAEFQRTPVREDYDELILAFMNVLYQLTHWGKQVPSEEVFKERVREYFQYSPEATHVLKALVSIAMQSRGRWGKSKQEREAEDAREVRRVLEWLHDPRAADRERQAEYMKAHPSLGGEELSE